jgi:hypothetical protein
MFFYRRVKWGVKKRRKGMSGDIDLMALLPVLLMHICWSKYRDGLGMLQVTKLA